MRRDLLMTLSVLALVACETAAPPQTSVPKSDAAIDASVEPPDAAARDAGLDLDPDASAQTPPDAGVVATDAGTPDARIAFRVVTFNTGTGANPPNLQDNGGYTDAESAISDQFYGNGLAWIPVIADVRNFFDTVAADVVVFQEVFYSGDCENIPPENHTGFVCERWAVGDPTVAQELLGPAWQIACHLGKNDKCAAVRRTFGSFAGCDQDLCLDGLDGARVMDCGSGSRVGRGLIELVGGGTLTLVNMHGSSGLLRADQECRERQLEQVFVDLGDGAPGANGRRNLVMGDFNTDPGRHTRFDSSAQRFNDFAGANRTFRFISEVGDQAEPTYANLFNIDHVISDFFEGSCWAAGITPGHDAVTDVVIFDHVPIVCDIQAP